VDAGSVRHFYILHPPALLCISDGRGLCLVAKAPRPKVCIDGVLRYEEEWAAVADWTVSKELRKYFNTL